MSNCTSWTRPILLATLLASSNASTAQTNLQFQQLPREVRERAAQVRKSCKELRQDAGSDFVINHEMQGITILSIRGDGASDIVVDDEGLCGAHLAGANCSNRACEMRIYKEVARGQWRKVFEESLYAKFLVIDYERMRLQMIVGAIYAGDPRCKPNPRKDYTSGMSCNLLVTYTDNGWKWQKVP